MATADQIKGLVKAYTDNDNERFKTIVLQIAAHEARNGHPSTARDLKELSDNIGNRRQTIFRMNEQNPMVLCSIPEVNLSDLVVSDEVESKIRRMLDEYRNRRKLASFGLNNRRKLLLEGNPGTGKTMTASVIAAEVSLPLYTVQVDKLVTKFMGETSVRLREIFDSMQARPGVYFFDEFDAIGADRSLDNEVGEMRRILNAFLQFIEQDSSESIIIAATNNRAILDKALFRRFDDVLHYSLPGREEIIRLITKKLDSFDVEKDILSEKVISAGEGLSQSEIAMSCDDAIKFAILANSAVTCDRLISFLEERHEIYERKNA